MRDELQALFEADAQRLRLLLRNAQRERIAGEPPKSFRALFQLLNETIE